MEIRPPAGPDRPVPDGSGGGDTLVSVDTLRDVPDGGTLRVARGAQVTPLAREEAFRRGIRLSHGGESGSSSCPRDGQPLRVAVGCDHGGFERKLDVLIWLRELGHRAIDLGTHDENAVDYPDYAQQVAEAVSEGRADVGVLIDGAGIGSAMAANKVPGIRAANCHDTKMAANAREHNYANVLTLGGRMIDVSTTYEVLRTFLATPFGAERHGRRVDKITAIERRYGRPGSEPAGRP
ncbi:MAG: ribose 5-phosphate isomerase B [Planctomycetota bacterium]